MANASCGVPVYTSAFDCTSKVLTHGGWPGWVDLGGWLRTEMVYPSVDSYPSKY